MAKQCTGCGRLDTEPIGLNKNGEPYLACCPDNNYVEISAVQWLKHKIKETYDKERKLPLAYTFSLLNKAEQIEKEQIIDAYDCGAVERHNDPVNGEQYYNEQYGK